MSKHTPGPWHAHEEKGCRWIQTEKEDVIAHVHRDVWSRDTFEANTRLIQAAPELLEAVTELSSALEYIVLGKKDPSEVVTEHLINTVNAAIAKATGASA